MPRNLNIAFDVQNETAQRRSNNACRARRAPREGRKMESSCVVVGSGKPGGKGVRRRPLSGCHGGRLVSEGDGSKLPGQVAPDSAASSGRSVAVMANRGRGRGGRPELRAAQRLSHDGYLLVELGRRVLGKARMPQRATGSLGGGSSSQGTGQGHGAGPVIVSLGAPRDWKPRFDATRNTGRLEGKGKESLARKEGASRGPFGRTKGQ